MAPTSSFHLVKVGEGGKVKSIRHIKDIGMRVNGGFFVFRNEIFDFIRAGEELVQEPFQRLAAAGTPVDLPLRRVLGVHGHVQGEADARGHVSRGQAPWEVWKSLDPGARAPKPSPGTKRDRESMETLQELLEKDLTHLAGSLRDEFKSMEGSNLLITGGAGFLGYYLVQSVLFWNERQAAGRPIHVTVVDNYRRGAPAWLARAARQPATSHWSSTTRRSPFPRGSGSSST